jgi:hypothetical protein
VIGDFRNGRGVFYNQDTYAGRTVFVRNLYHCGHFLAAKVGISDHETPSWGRAQVAFGQRVHGSAQSREFRGDRHIVGSRRQQGHELHAGRVAHTHVTRVMSDRASWTPPSASPGVG